MIKRFDKDPRGTLVVVVVVVVVVGGGGDGGSGVVEIRLKTRLLSERFGN